MRGQAIAAGFLAVFWLSGAASGAARPDPSGVWMRGDGNARVRIAPCGSSICAVNLWIKDTSGGEAVGDKLVMTVQPKSADTLAGKAFDAKRNLTYSIQIKVAKSSLTTRGCVVGNLVCKSVSWSRVH
jgi:uncharacterized protein (DUF2147 family)